jgi:hypothetical protein
MFRPHLDGIRNQRRRWGKCLRRLPRPFDIAKILWNNGGPASGVAQDILGQSRRNIRFGTNIMRD